MDYTAVDVIGIGAINYDYMFRCRKRPDSIISVDKSSDNSREELGWSIEKVRQDIQQLYDSKFAECSTQLGGSSLLAMRALKIVNPKATIGYIGVCGEYDNFDLSFNKKYLKDLKTELRFIDNQEWLFHTINMADCPEKV